MAEMSENPEKPLAVFVETNNGGLISFWNLSLLFSSRDGWLEPLDTEGEQVICLDHANGSVCSCDEIAGWSF